MRSFVQLALFSLALSVAACGESSVGSGGMAGTGGSAGSAGSGGGAAGEGGAGGLAGAGGSGGLGGAAGDGGAGGMGGDAGEGGTGGQGGGMQASGVCNNSADLAAMASAGESLQSIGGDCGLDSCLGNIGNPAAFSTCVSTCIETAVGVSSACAGCYGEVGGCGLAASCFACATNTCSQNCLDCLNGASCLTSLDTCTGLPAEVCT